MSRIKFTVLICAAAWTLEADADSEHQSVPKELPIAWSGGDGLINRVMSFRTNDWTEWASLWKAMFENSRSLPEIDFKEYEIIGVVLPHADLQRPVRFAPEFEEGDDSLTLTLERSKMQISSGPMTGSRYAFALVPKSKKKIFIRSAAQLEEPALLPVDTVETGALAGDQNNALPTLPLHLNGSADCGREPEERVEVFFAGKAVCDAGDRVFRLAHVMIRAKGAKMFDGSTSNGNSLYEGFGCWNEYYFQMGESRVTVHVEISERDRTLKVGDSAYHLEHGNFILIELDHDGKQTTTQLPIVITRQQDDHDSCEDAKQFFLRSIEEAKGNK